MTPEDLSAEVDRLRREWSTGDPTDRGLRGRVEERLTALRALYRTQPAAFGTDEVLVLRAVSDALRRPASSARAELKAIFGYDSFRLGQEPIIEAVLAGRDCVGVMPTGAGKSLTYQLPARLLGGTTLVVSPLIALMKDQVDALSELGIRATFLNSTLEPDERARRIEALKQGHFEIVYAAPEGLEASVGEALRRNVRLSLIAVDEAHCISQWGHDFRPAYRNLTRLRKRFGDVPLLALTATATEEVVRDIMAQLGMRDPAVYRGSFFRPNLRVHAYKKGGDDAINVRESILRLVSARRGESGIVYCLSRKSVDGMAAYLVKNGVASRAYHAGMSPDERSDAQDAFRRDDVDVMVATIAFGMGIDKSNIRFVIHRDMPRSIEGYYQEIGRAGRDGVASDCVLFYSWADVINFDRFSDGSDIAERHQRQAREMFRLAEAGGCRHSALVGYLGEKIGPCGRSCDVCAGSDVISEAPRVLSKRERRQQEASLSPPTTEHSPKPRPDLEGGTESGDLFQMLRALRKRLADERRVPAYFIFSDATLIEMAKLHPRNERELLGISGIGPKKLEQYGDIFLEALRRHPSPVAPK
jgi:ATP-dependent DNA helicase RecQ